MSPIIVASKFVWSHYPGMRAGRIYAGKSDLTRHPNAETHLVAGPDAVETLCGLPRAQFPHEFAEGTAPGKRAELCVTCLPAAQS
ncbi:hypothetical protein LQ327_29770 [Actinomycetospora endophytica]|uniref:Uncharacterized protein n=1 Tax=Actinomycetospora endophytica TaxID=2291215 RepID=A0ABS8PH15_9PSEU|nr:hypothetical protein [Actinomycetospora endophytica]MCD2197566.1 hypothetical protein [Actinomycetospora endophytica]